MANRLLVAMFILAFALTAVLGGAVVGDERQVSRARIIARQAAKAEASKAQTIGGLQRRNPTRPRALYPRQSAPVYPTCAETSLGAGYASFLVNAPGNNLGPTTMPGNVSACRDLCDTTTNCVGFAFGNTAGSCSLKQNRAATIATLPSGDTNWRSYIKGDCASVAASSSVSCCNSRAYPTCSSSSSRDVGAGFAFYSTNSPGNGIGGFVSATSPADCVTACNANPSCVAFSYQSQPNRCSLKQNLVSVYQNIDDNTGWTTYIRGSCTQGAAHSDNTCCDTS